MTETVAKNRSPEHELASAEHRARKERARRLMLLYQEGINFAAAAELTAKADAVAAAAAALPTDAAAAQHTTAESAPRDAV